MLKVKRLFDIIVAGTALVMLAPVILLVAVAIKLDDRGAVLFVQPRVGLRGRLFRCLKFRSMVVDAERKGRGLEIEKGDSRITRVGGFLRQWTLDEIPQLVNVLKGEMSMVGPRPTVPSQVERYTAAQRRRLDMKPGMTGWAIIHGRNTLSWTRRIELDIWYIEHWSIALDAYILVKSFWVLLTREGLYDADGLVRDLE